MAAAVTALVSDAKRKIVFRVIGAAVLEALPAHGRELGPAAAGDQGDGARQHAGVDVPLKHRAESRHGLNRNTLTCSLQLVLEDPVLTVRHTSR